ncbi:hypothetical protein CA601_03925 [Paraburkholderia hospita]|nr:hypothetical protein CA601_03925 [Paraburkholderia hospita]
MLAARSVFGSEAQPVSTIVATIKLATAEVESVLLSMIFYLWIESADAIGQCLWMEVTLTATFRHRQAI